MFTLQAALNRCDGLQDGETLKVTAMERRELLLDSRAARFLNPVDVYTGGISIMGHALEVVDAN